jgi:hypothetical protein
VQADEVRLKCVDQQGHPLWFMAPDVVLTPGVNQCSVFCPVSALFTVEYAHLNDQAAFAGTLGLDVFQIRISRIVFQYALRPSSRSKGLSNDMHNYEWKLKVLEDPQSLRVYVQQHKEGKLRVRR